MAPHVAAGKLHLVPGAPKFFYPVYAVCSARADDSMVEAALKGLRFVAASDRPLT